MGHFMMYLVPMLQLWGALTVLGVVGITLILVDEYFYQKKLNQEKTFLY